MYLKEFSANWLFQFQFLQICFRIRPKLSCLWMIHKLILYFFRLARSEHLPCNFFPSIIQKQTDSCRGSLLRSTDTRTEQYVGQRIKPHIHTDDIGRNNTGIGSIDSNSFCFQPLRKFTGKKPQSQFCITVNRDTPKTASFSTNQKFRSNLPYGIRARNHVHNPGSLSHQRQ